MRFFSGFIAPIILEFGLISATVGLYFGPLYLANMWGMLGLYSLFTFKYSKTRQIYIWDWFKEGKKSEFFMNESVLNFETVKYF